MQDVIGSTASATVQSVRCRRIQLARKTILCSRHFTQEQAIQEVAHLKRLEHSHIVRVIGTYVLGKKLSILLYPLAEYNLETFCEAMEESVSPDDLDEMVLSCMGFFSCLTFTIEYIHSMLTKHMDIKPSNILVRDERYKMPADTPWKAYTVYVADFGIARSYEQLQATETDGPTSFTPKYAAPEVVLQDKRGLSADIFSLGCVFLELMAALSSKNCPDLLDTTYHSPGVKTYRQPDSSVLQYMWPTLSRALLESALGDESGRVTAYYPKTYLIRKELSTLGTWTVSTLR